MQAHKGRTKIVFGDGHPQAKLLLIGEGPGRDEDLQGLPLGGFECPRRGKLLTQMIEAMDLRPQRRLHLQCGEMPATGESRAGKR